MLQDVDAPALAARARTHDVVIRVVAEVGDFVPAGAEVVEIWRRNGGPCSLGWDEVERCLGFGPERTMTSDLAFGFRQLADIGTKALSPAINDPTTAVQCLDRLHDLLRTEAGRPPLARVHADVEGTVRVVHATIGWAELLHLALDEIRIYGAGSMQVVRRIRAVLEDLASVATDAELDAVAEHVGLLERAVRRSVVDEVDRRRAGVADEQGIGDDEV